MNRDEIWKRIKEDETEVYGEPIFDQFLKLADNLSPEHVLGLDPRKRALLSPEVRFLFARDEAEAKRAMKDGAENFGRAFLQAAKDGRSEVVGFIIDMTQREALDYWKGADYAAVGGHLEALRTIFEKASKRGIPINNPQYILQDACKQGKTKVVEYLIGRGVQVLTHTILFTARNGHLDTVKLLVRHGVTESQLNGSLYEAATGGHNAVIDYLVKSGAKDLDNALYLAVRDNKLSTIKHLIELGAKDIERVMAYARGPAKELLERIKGEK